MCGIAGRVGPAAKSGDQLDKMLKSLVHRGPDEGGVYTGEDVEIGMRRLSIIDIAGGHQPVTNETGRYQLVFNGEIYNFQELRGSLSRKGHAFKSKSDSEVIVHLYEDFGVAAFAKLRGMFAIAIWDTETKTLVLARDHLGKKPLVFASINGNLIFASETKAILEGAKNLGFRLNPNFNAINDYLAFGYVPSPKNAFQEVHSLKPGSVLVWQNGSYSETSFWVPNQEENTEITFAEAVGEAERLIVQAVKRRLISERPLGSFLSGGVDSALVTAIANSISETKLSTFTIGFAHPAYDESQHAESVANHLQTNHHTFNSEVSPIDLLTRLGSAFDQPFADSSALPTLLLSEKTREHVVVALSGDGGDEIFLGYERYKYIPRLQQFNSLASALKPFRGAVNGFANATNNRKLARLGKEFNSHKTLSSRYIAGMTMTSLAERRNLLHKDLLGQISILNSPEVEYERSILQWKTFDAAQQLAKSDISRYLPDDLLVKVDIASMKSSLEVRTPLLDLDLVDFALSLPKKIHMHNGESKSILKAILSKYVPKELFDRPKMGFAIPRAEWLRTDLHEMTHDLLLDNTSRARRWLNLDAIEGLLREHDSGTDCDELIWPLLCLELWARNWLDSSTVI